MLTNVTGKGGRGQLRYVSHPAVLLFVIERDPIVEGAAGGCGVNYGVDLRASTRQRVTKGPGWRAVNAPHLVAFVRAGVTFEKGKLVQRLDESGRDQQVA